MTALVLVAAVADNGIIGSDGSLPWWLPGDLEHFREVTMGKPIVMGRRTFDSIGRALPGRTSIVLSGNANFHAEGVRTAPNLDAALAIAEAEAKRLSIGEIAVIGGRTLYAETLPRAARIYLTEVHAKPDGNSGQCFAGAGRRGTADQRECCSGQWVYGHGERRNRRTAGRCDCAAGYA